MATLEGGIDYRDRDVPACGLTMPTMAKIPGLTGPAAEKARQAELCTLARPRSLSFTALQLDFIATFHRTQSANGNYWYYQTPTS